MADSKQRAPSNQAIIDEISSLLNKVEKNLENLLKPINQKQEVDNQRLT